jgi:hypothetical protein
LKVIVTLILDLRTGITVGALKDYVIEAVEGWTGLRRPEDPLLNGVKVTQIAACQPEIVRKDV